MNKHRHARREHESTLDWIKRISNKNDSWYHKVKRWKQFGWLKLTILSRVEIIVFSFIIALLLVYFIFIH